MKQLSESHTSTILYFCIRFLSRNEIQLLFSGGCTIVCGEAHFSYTAAGNLRRIWQGVNPTGKKPFMDVPMCYSLVGINSG
jgi:hypothetical protein